MDIEIVHRACCKYILGTSSSRLPRASYDMLYSFDNVGTKNWATEIKHKLYNYRFGEVWVKQSVGDVNMFLYLFKQRVDVATHE